MTGLPTGIRTKSGFLYIEFQVRGKRHYESTGLSAQTVQGKPHQQHIRTASTLRRRRIEATTFGIEPEATQAIDLRSGTFAEVAQAFLNEATVKASTRQAYKQLLQTYWMPTLQDRQIQAIELPLLRQILRDTQWSSRKVETNAVSALRQVFTHAQEDGYREDHPAQHLVVRKRRGAANDRATLKHAYSEDERDTLLHWLGAHTAPSIHAYFVTAFYTGMRTGELLALSWDDYDGQRLRVNKARVRGDITTTKTDTVRFVALPETLIRVLNALPSRFQRQTVFTNQYGKPYRSGYHLNKAFRTAHAATEIRHRTGPYPWRHTYASIGLTHGVEPAWLAKQLGHSLQMFYTVYAEWIDSSERDQRELAKLT